MKATKKQGRGRPAKFGVAMDRKTSFRLNDDQAEAVSAWCETKGVPVVVLFREAALIRAGKSKLGNGLKKAEGSRGVKAGPLTVKLTDAQFDALQALCEKRGIEVGFWTRESALMHIGRGDLGAAGKLADAREAMGARA